MRQKCLELVAKTFRQRDKFDPVVNAVVRAGPAVPDKARKLYLGGIIVELEVQNETLADVKPLNFRQDAGTAGT